MASICLGLNVLTHWEDITGNNLNKMLTQPVNLDLKGLICQ